MRKLVKPGGIPVALVRHEPGRYRRWQHDERRVWPEARADTRHWKPQDHQERRPPQEANHQGNGKGHDGDHREQDNRH